MVDNRYLVDIFKIFKKRLKLICFMALFSASITWAVSHYLLTPVYQSSTQILVNQKTSENQLDFNRLQSNVELINTYSEIIKSPAILEKVINKLNFKQTVEEINQKMSINSRQNTQVFSITIEDTDASRAVKISNTIAETFQQEIRGIMNVDNVSILAKAELKETPVPVKPNQLLNVAISVVVSLVLAIVISILLDVFDNTLKHEEDVASELGLPVLGSIQKMTYIQKKIINDSKIKQVGSETIVSYAKE